MRKWAMTIAVAGFVPVLMGTKGCVSDCDKVRAAVELACGADPASVECAAAQRLLKERCQVPAPEPTPTPTPTPPPAEDPCTLCPEGTECVLIPRVGLPPIVTCVPPPAPEPTPTPTPPPVSSCSPHPDDEGWRVVPNYQAQLYAEYRIVVQAVGNTCGAASPDESLQRATLDRVAAVWREKFPGRCVTSPKDWDNVGDSVSVKTADGVFEEWHAVYFGNGCIIEGSNAMKNGWVCPGCTVQGPEPEPTPEPPSSSGCSAPVTPKVNRWNLKPHNRWYDSTPLFYGKGEDGYCAKIGFPDRLFCPARSECPGFKCEERAACEKVGIGGLPLWRCEVGQAEVNENPYLARCPEGTWIEVCSADGTVCERKTIE